MYLCLLGYGLIAEVLFDVQVLLHLRLVRDKWRHYLLIEELAPVHVYEEGVSDNVHGIFFRAS